MNDGKTDNRNTLNRAWPLFLLLVSTALLNTGCSHPPPPIERDPCLDEGPLHSAAYDDCVVDRNDERAAALNAILGNGPDLYPQMRLAEPGEDTFQESDYPDTPSPMSYRTARSISATEQQALPFKMKVRWNYTSRKLLPRPRDLVRMNEMEALLLSAAADDGLAKWIFYARSDTDFMNQMQALLAPSGPYPVEWSGRKEPARNAERANSADPSGEIRITPKRCLE
ncbi:MULTISPECIES: DUF695 domain-containing protein [unclassified Pseudomonas]|uniref:DUF695 domain-containing protein n=1 Tax=unclassified Pseudomonas TaxID=196821 RepID=UPI00289377FC|nr:MULTISPECIES: DUF695 domain-containing protein [unclassified Pseudomonas]